MKIETDIAVVGGGTAGWLAALYSNLYYPNTSITVVASEEIGILGAGEGTTPGFVKTLEKLNISPQEVISKCKGTIKVGIEFKNWHGDGTSFFHPFSSFSSSKFCFNSIKKEELAYTISKKEKVWGLSEHAYLASAGKVPFAFDTPEQLTNKAFYALHFDAVLLAKYLKEVALKRGINYIDAVVEDVILSENKNVSELHLSTSQTVHPKFVFDCSGLRRLIIGGKLEAEWVSYSDTLKTNKAMPFFVPHNNDTKPVTTAIAMKYGWVWQIPVQDRYGCGYVFDNTKVGVAEARKEVEEYFGISITNDKVFDYSPGCYKTPLVSNCLAVGLAHSFLEPMEATSIWMTCMMLNYFLSRGGPNHNIALFNREFNDKFYSITSEFKDFIALHYKTNRTDTTFWEEVSIMPIPIVEDYIEALNCNLAYPLPVQNFERYSWVLFLDELGYLNTNSIANQIPAKDTDRLSYWFDSIKKELHKSPERHISHKQLINIVTG